MLSFLRPSGIRNALWCDYVDPDMQVAQYPIRNVTRRSFSMLLSAEVGEPMRLSRALGPAYCDEDLRIYRPDWTSSVRLGSAEDRPLAVVAFRLMVHPEHSDYGPPGLALRAHEQNLLEYAEGIRCDLQRGLFGESSPVGVRVLPSSWSWRRVWSPGLVAVARVRDYPALFTGA